MTKTQPVEVTAQEFLGIVNATREQSGGSSVVISNYRIIPDTNGEKILSTTENPADLRYCTFTDIDFNGVCMKGALLNDFTIEKCNLRGTNFKYVKGRFNILCSDVSDAEFCLERCSGITIRKSYYFIGHKPKYIMSTNDVDLVLLNATAYNLIKQIKSPNQVSLVLQLANPKKSPEELIGALCNINHSNPRLGGALARIATGQLTNAR